MEPTDDEAYLLDAARRRTLAEEVEEFEVALRALRDACVEEVRTIAVAGLGLALWALAVVRRSLR